MDAGHTQCSVKEPQSPAAGQGPTPPRQASKERRNKGGSSWKAGWAVF